MRSAALRRCAAIDALAGLDQPGDALRVDRGVSIAPATGRAAHGEDVGLERPSRGSRLIQRAGQRDEPARLPRPRRSSLPSSVDAVPRDLSHVSKGCPGTRGSRGRLDDGSRIGCPPLPSRDRPRRPRPGWPRRLFPARRRSRLASAPPVWRRARQPELAERIPSQHPRGISTARDAPFVELAERDTDHNRWRNDVAHRRQTVHGALPSDPRDGSLTSMIAAPPARAARASSSHRTLTSSMATTRVIAWVQAVREIRHFSPLAGPPRPDSAVSRSRGGQSEQGTSSDQIGREGITEKRDRHDVTLDQTGVGQGIELPLRPRRKVGRDEKHQGEPNGERPGTIQGRILGC